MAGRPGRRRSPRVGRRQRRQEHSASAAQPNAAAPSTAAAILPPSRSRPVQRAIAAHPNADIAPQAGAAQIAAAEPSYAAVTRSQPSPLQSRTD